MCTAINHTAFNNRRLFETIYDQQKKTVKMMMMYFNFSGPPGRSDAHSSLLYDIMVEFSEHFL